MQNRVNAALDSVFSTPTDLSEGCHPGDPHILSVIDRIVIKFNLDSYREAVPGDLIFKAICM